MYTLRETLEKFSVALLEGKANNQCHLPPLDSNLEHYSKLTQAIMYGRLDEIKLLRNNKKYPWFIGNLIWGIYFCDYATADKILRYAITDTGDGRHITQKYLRDNCLAEHCVKNPVLYEWIYKNIPSIFHDGQKFSLCGMDFPLDERPADMHGRYLFYALAAPPKERMECSPMSITFWFFLDHYHPLDKWLPSSLQFNENDYCHPQFKYLSPGLSSVKIENKNSLLPLASWIYLGGHRMLLKYLSLHLLPELYNIVRNYLLLYEMLFEGDGDDFSL